MRSLIATALASGMLAAGCGGSDDDEAPPEPAASALVFSSDDVAFSFDYPKDFTAETEPSGQVLGQVSVEKGATLNAIKVRKTSEQELERDRYLDEFKRDFERTVGEVEKREERIGDLDTGVLEFDDTVSQLGQRVEFVSTSYFFSGAGKTWQIECIADSEHREEIAAACMQALETVDFDS